MLLLHVMAAATSERSSSRYAYHYDFCFQQKALHSLHCKPYTQYLDASVGRAIGQPHWHAPA